MIAMMSMWRNDARRRLDERASHLIAKTCSTHGVRLIWMVGDSDDATESMLRTYADKCPRVSVVRHDTYVIGDDTPRRRVRSAQTANAMFDELIDGCDDLACLHESDIVSPVDLLDRLLVNRPPVAAWPTIVLGGRRVFYDIWAFRDLRGQCFGQATEPRPVPFAVSSFGSVWIAPASLVRGRRIGPDCVVDLCRQWRDEGVELLADPRIGVEQPADLWEAA